MWFKLVATSEDVKEYLELLSELSLHYEITGEQEYLLKINSIEDLLNLSEKLKLELIVRGAKTYHEEKYPSLEIYDDYRE